jgi:hypothetical protein
MATHKLWPGAPGSIVEPPGAPAVREKKDHPEVSLNGKRYAWTPGHEDGIPEEALAIWRRFLEANP